MTVKEKNCIQHSSLLSADVQKKGVCMFWGGGGGRVINCGPASVAITE